MANVYTDRCTDSEVWLTRDADKNAFGDVFREGVASSIPIVGELMAAFVPDTMTNNVVRSCPGVTIDRRSSFCRGLHFSCRSSSNNFNIFYL